MASEIDPNLGRAIYGLISVLVGNTLIGWGRSLYAKHMLFKQLAAETKEICAAIENNADLILPGQSEGRSVPLLRRLRTPIHAAKIGDIIVYDELGKLASTFMFQCEHYNEIIRLAETDREKVQRKREILNQGGLIHNHPPQLFLVASNGEKTPYTGMAEGYLAELRRQSKRLLGFIKWFPWYLIILRREFFHESHSA